MIPKPDRRRRLAESVHCNRGVRERTWNSRGLHQLFNVRAHVSIYANCYQSLFSCSVERGSQGAWQRFERGELPLFQFYEAFGKDLSDTANGNVWYQDYCKRKGIGGSVAS